MYTQLDHCLGFVSDKGSSRLSPRNICWLWPFGFDLNKGSSRQSPHILLWGSFLHLLSHERLQNHPNMNCPASGKKHQGVSEKRWRKWGENDYLYIIVCTYIPLNHRELGRPRLQCRQGECSRERYSTKIWVKVLWGCGCRLGIMPRILLSMSMVGWVFFLTFFDEGFSLV